MTTFRIRKTKRYTTIENEAIQDSRLSYKARGIHHLLLSYPDDWEVNLKHLIKQSAKDGRDAVTAGVKELEGFGYIVRVQGRAENGKFGNSSFDVYEIPLTENPSTDKPPTDQPCTENPSTEKPLTENPQQLKTYRTKDLKNKDLLDQSPHTPQMGGRVESEETSFSQEVDESTCDNSTLDSSTDDSGFVDGDQSSAPPLDFSTKISLNKIKQLSVDELDPFYRAWLNHKPGSFLSYGGDRLTTLAVKGLKRFLRACLEDSQITNPMAVFTYGLNQMSEEEFILQQATDWTLDQYLTNNKPIRYAYKWLAKARQHRVSSEAVQIANAEQAKVVLGKQMSRVGITAVLPLEWQERGGCQTWHSLTEDLLVEYVNHLMSLPDGHFREGVAA